MSRDECGACSSRKAWAPLAIEEAPAPRQDLDRSEQVAFPKGVQRSRKSESLVRRQLIDDCRQSVRWRASQNKPASLGGDITWTATDEGWLSFFIPSFSLMAHC